MRMSSAMDFFFSPEGKFFREFLLDETVKGVDVLSRNGLIHLPQLVPGPAGQALQTAGMFTPEPLRALVPDLTVNEKKVLRSTTAVLDFFLPGGAAPGLATQNNLMSTPSVNEAVQTAQ